MTTKYYTKEYAETIERVKAFAQKNYQPLSQKKIYYFHGRNQIGEERVAEYFKSKGYAIVRPEKIPLEEQLNILANCEDFASPVGSISHNTMFMQSDKNAIFIPRLGNDASNNYQLAFNQLNSLNATYVDSTLSLFNRDHTGPYCYILSKQLRNFFGDEVAEEYDDKDFGAFLLYSRFAIANGIKMNADAVKYYGRYCTDYFAQLQKRQDLMQKYGVQFK